MSIAIQLLAYIHEHTLDSQSTRDQFMDPIGYARDVAYRAGWRDAMQLAARKVSELSSLAEDKRTDLEVAKAGAPRDHALAITYRTPTGTLSRVDRIYGLTHGAASILCDAMVSRGTEASVEYVGRRTEVAIVEVKS